LEQPAAAAAAAVDQEMAVQVEVPLEERIANLEHDIKAIKAANLKTPQLVAYLAHSEAELLKLREQQRQERPLPARLQAATHRVEKAAADEAEAMKELAGHEAHATRLKTKLVEIAGQKQAAEKELEAVKAMAGAGVSEVVCGNFAGYMQQELAKQGMQEQQVVLLMQAVWGRMQLGTMLPQAGQQGPAAAAAPAAPQPQPPAAAAAPSAMDQVRLANMGAALAAAEAQEQAAQAHAAAAQAAAESQAAAAKAAAQAAAEATQQRAAMLAAAQAEELQQ
jgi:hypothetical protein